MELLILIYSWSAKIFMKAGTFSISLHNRSSIDTIESLEKKDIHAKLRNFNYTVSKLSTQLPLFIQVALSY